MRIGIIDYGMGNIHSVKKAVEFFGFKARIINNPKELKSIDKLILPGVGGFSYALKNIKKLNLYSTLRDYLLKDRLFLGICLGMQILFERSQEAEGEKGLGIIKGEVLRFNLKSSFKIPHIGWNRLNFKNPKCILFKNIPDGAYVYFCHSFYPLPEDDKIVCATTDYSIRFSSVIQKGNIFGIQFHPEKSQKIGLKIIENFLKL
ncbi:MAG: imidazole glycerol phosphate synthase subunit HisH [Candidatus Omnitrophica bacterium]|nr:imidazole glycerol phosphate synthase subunit HisH [Candidatus Omnitrophota bacterium]MCM8800072.1 imidazole glycerol phosphate synthase subunit HisH [Candidatus Omnitrophota bacterium]